MYLKRPSLKANGLWVRISRKKKIDISKDFSPTNQIKIAFRERMKNKIHIQISLKTLKTKNQCNQIFLRKDLQTLKGWINKTHICHFNKAIIHIC